MTATVSVTHDGVAYDGQIATIKSTMLGTEDHGIFTAHLTCEWPGGGISVGGYSLDTPAEGDSYDREGTAFGLDHVIAIMRTVGVSRWEALPGQHVIVLFESGKGGWGGRSIGLASINGDRAVVFETHAQAWRDRAAVAS